MRNPLEDIVDIRSLFRFALPSVMMMIFMGLYTVVDTIFVSRLAGTDALSAMNIVCPVINLIVGAGTMLATGASAVIAREMGAGEQEQASRDFTFIICAGIILGVLISVTGILFIDQLIMALGASSRFSVLRCEYLFLCIFYGAV